MAIGDWLVKRIKDLTRTATSSDLTDGEFVAVDKTAGYTRKMTVANLAMWVLGKIKNLPDKNEGYGVLVDANGVGKFDFNRIGDVKILPGRDGKCCNITTADMTFHFNVTGGVIFVGNAQYSLPPIGYRDIPFSGIDAVAVAITFNPSTGLASAYARLDVPADEVILCVIRTDVVLNPTQIVGVAAPFDVTVDGAEEIKAAFPTMFLYDFDIVSKQPNFPVHDSTFVGNDLWVFDYNRDAQNRFGGKIYNTDLDQIGTLNTEFRWDKSDGTGTQELEMKSVDYNEYNGMLLVGNGSARTVSMPNDQYLFIFHDVTGWANSQEKITFANCGGFTKLDVHEIGVKVYAVWASKSQRCDKILVIANGFDKVCLCRLGKGSNQLSKGVYTAQPSGVYNGTYEILKTWTCAVSKNNYSRMTPHGVQYYKGRLYGGVVDYDTCTIFAIDLNVDGSMVLNQIRTEAYSDSSNFIEYRYPNGIAIKDDVLYTSTLINDGVHESDNNKKVFKVYL